MSITLTWDSTYAIALALKRIYPQVDLATVRLGQIYEWTLALPEFQDDPSLCNDDILSAILRDWYEETIYG